jgi:hypothetical protein
MLYGELLGCWSKGAGLVFAGCWGGPKGTAGRRWTTLASLDAMLVGGFSGSWSGCHLVRSQEAIRAEVNSHLYNKCIYVRQRVSPPLVFVQ